MRSLYVCPLIRGLIVLAFCTLLLNGQIMLTPVQDVYIYTFGGGQGANVFLKYDIHSLPTGQIIDSVFLTPYVHYVAASWDSDAKYFNVNSQTWTGADSARFIYSIATSDSTHQSSGFATAVGLARSVDLKNILITDYSAGHTFCSIKIKDPDDPTFMPPPGSYPVNSNETLALGEVLNNRYVHFYPSEYANAPPWLIIYCHEVALSENLNCGIQISGIYPNPFSRSVAIHCSPTAGTYVAAVIYNALGIEIAVLPHKTDLENISVFTWDGRDKSGIQQPGGTYFCILRNGDQLRSIKLNLIR